MRKLTLGIALLAALGAGAAIAQTTTLVGGTAPGVAAAVETESYTGSISAIDAARRMISVKGDGGGVAEINAGPEVKNFDQLKVGDRVTIELTKALALELRMGAPRRSRARTKPTGSRPAPARRRAARSARARRSWPRSLQWTRRRAPSH